MENFFSSPKVMSAWFKDLALKSHAFKCELRLPSEESSINKSAAFFDSGAYLASLTVWGNGTGEWILFDVNLEKEIEVNNFEFHSESELVLLMNSFINRLATIASK